MAEVTVLDSEFLKKFISEHIEPFVAALGKIAKDDPKDGPAMESVSEGIDTTTITATKPLILGGMAGENAAAGGGELNAVVQKAAGEIVRVFEDHSVLFEDVQDALWETIEQLNKSQGKGLETIAMEEFMDIFEDVDSDLTGDGDDEDDS
ncbi:type VII secretion system-associated protein [Streptomyces sp. NPDC046862]|uniref:type VII secretion system-associated protein n=1 Tax=Streptomyces sp. NPDC046862 TaxID=3154603 RepID=UPI0034557E72